MRLGAPLFNKTRDIRSGARGGILQQTSVSPGHGPFPAIYSVPEDPR